MQWKLGSFFLTDAVLIRWRRQEKSLILEFLVFIRMLEKYQSQSDKQLHINVIIQQLHGHWSKHLWSTEQLIFLSLKREIDNYNGLRWLKPNYSPCKKIINLWCVSFDTQTCSEQQLILSWGFQEVNTYKVLLCSERKIIKS